MAKNSNKTLYRQNPAFSQATSEDQFLVSDTEVPCFSVGTFGGQTGDMACGFPFRADPPEGAPHCPQSQPALLPFSLWVRWTEGERAEEKTLGKNVNCFCLEKSFLFSAQKIQRASWSSERVFAVPTPCISTVSTVDQALLQLSRAPYQLSISHSPLL